MTIERINAHCFKTADGQEHPTWNAARRHLTMVELARDIRRSTRIEIDSIQAEAMAAKLLADWNISKRGPK